jgi:siroheme synthase-like protein
MFYPVFIELRDRHVLVVGGGPIAERKVGTLLDAGAKVTVVSPTATEGLVNSPIEWKRRVFQESDLDGMLLAIAATDDTETQKQVVTAARARNILVNTVDVPNLCDFIVPAVLNKGDVIVAISTSGKSPALAAALKTRLESWLTEDIGRAANVLGAVRGELHERIGDPDGRKRVFEAILRSGFLDWIAECDDATALKRVRDIIDQSV